MAASDTIFSIKLTENDVPGAKFRCNDVSEHSVCEIKRWLHCRGLSVGGKKPELVERCRSCMDAGCADDIIISIDNGKWYEKKVNEILKQVRKGDTQSEEVPLLPTLGWQNFPACTMPKGFCYGSIYEHIISSAKVVQVSQQSGSDTESSLLDFNTSKPMLKGRHYFTSGHVKNIKHQRKGDFQFFKCDVMASYTISTVYKVSVTLSYPDGKVMDASCECKASSMGRCNHVAGLLFTLEDYVINFGHECASTSKLCTWNIGKKSKRDPQTCQSATYSKKMKPDRIISFDPRSEQVDEDAFVNNFIASLPSCGTQTMFQKVLEINYSDYAVEKDILKQMTKTSIQSFRETCSSQSPYEIGNTKSQSLSEEWYFHRAVRITASNAKRFASTKTVRGKYILLEQTLWGKKLPNLKALEYGKKNEEAAFDQYTKGQNDKFCYKRAGFWVNRNFPELGCSPDGLIYNLEGTLIGVLEIKCPYILETIHPKNVDELKKKQKYNLCYSIVDGQIKLKRDHAYFYQIQMQMAICDVKFCDFILWSPKGMNVERIDYDSQFWNDLCPKLLNFHHNILMPEYIEMRIPRRLMPVDLQNQ